MRLWRQSDLQRVLRYTNRKGEVWDYALWRMIHHVVNHSTYHRGQVTNMLRLLGAQRRRRTSSSSGTNGRRAGECEDDETEAWIGEEAR